MNDVIDFDVHGLASVRLVNATRADAAAVQAQLRLPPAQLDTEPDVVIRYVPALEVRGPLRFVGLDDAGFVRDAFMVLRDRHTSRARVKIPFQDVGGRCELVCEAGMGRVPLLNAIVNLTVLAKGGLALNAAAFRVNGTCVLTTGWLNGGKTETLLAFMANGAAFVGDEWVYASRDGSKVYGLPESIRLLGWHLESLPQFRSAIPRGQRARIRMASMMLDGLRRMTANGARRSAASRTLRRMTPILRRQLRVDIAPSRLFGDRACELSGTPDRVFFIASQEAPEVSVRPIDPEEVARRMVYSLQESQRALMSYYWKFRFAFPGAGNDLIERSRELQEAALLRLLGRKAAFDVRHPYPVELPALYDALRPYCA